MAGKSSRKMAIIAIKGTGELQVFLTGEPLGSLQTAPVWTGPSDSEDEVGAGNQHEKRGCHRRN